MATLNSFLATLEPRVHSRTRKKQVEGDSSLFRSTFAIEMPCETVLDLDLNAKCLPVVTLLFCGSCKFLSNHHAKGSDFTIKPVLGRLELDNRKEYHIILKCEDYNTLCVLFETLEEVNILKVSSGHCCWHYIVY